MSIEAKLAALGFVNVGFYTVLNIINILWYLGYQYTWQDHLFVIVTSSDGTFVYPYNKRMCYFDTLIEQF